MFQTLHHIINSFTTINFEISLAGGILFAKKIRKSGYVTMIDPMQERYGKFMGGILFIPALVGEVLWVATMFGALAKTFTVVVGDHMNFLVILVALVTVFNSAFGGLHNVAVLNVVQLICLVVGIVSFILQNIFTTKKIYFSL